MNADGTPAPGLRRSPLFGLVAPSLGWFPPLRYLLRRRRILRLFDGIAPGRLVEVGCGAGALLDDFGGRGHAATGVETSPRALALARVLAAGGGRTGGVRGAPDPAWAGALDTVCAFDVLEHIEDDLGAVREWLSWLRPDGRLVLSVPAHRHRWGAGDEWAGHFRRYDRADLGRLLAAAGAVAERIECYGFPLANLSERLGERTYRRLMRERAAPASLAEATAESGVERRDAGRLFRWLDTLPGRVGLRLAFLCQHLFARTDLGSGYLLVARRR